MKHTNQRAVVLAIDDSPLIHELLAARLAPEQIDVHRALTAEEGIKLARTLQPDLILLDVDLPGMDGFEACHRLKKELSTAEVPIVFLTGTDDKRQLIQGLDAGAVDYIIKPFDGAELRARVRAALRTKRCHDRLAMRCLLDGLTGLWNRAYFEQRMEEELRAAARYGRIVSLAMIDLDGFKQVNDVHGHLAGDHTIKVVGTALQLMTRATDAPCRFGGDEFAMILTETPLVGADVLAQRVVTEISNVRISFAGATFSVGTSIGIASTEQLASVGDEARDELLALADGALLDAKQAGRNRVCVAKGGMPVSARMTGS